MLKIFWDKDNIGFIGDRVNSEEHSHCILQAFMSLDEPLQVTVKNEKISGKCVIVNKDVKHIFSCGGKTNLSVLIEPSSSFANGLIAEMNGDYLICDYEDIGELQQKAALLVAADGKEQYAEFIRRFSEYLGGERKDIILDERIAELLQLFKTCDCYDHTIESFAEKVSLSASRLSHLFREQIGVPLKSYILFHQLEKAFNALLSGKSVTDAAMLAGFDSPSHFAATVKKWMGMSVSSSVKNSGFLKVFI